MLAEVRQMAVSLEALAGFLSALPAPVTVALESCLYWQWLHDQLDAQRYRFVSAIRHYSGGPALDISFAIGMNGQTSDFYEAASALLPSDSVQIRSQLVTGPSPRSQDTVHWHFRFKDATGRSYALEQTFQLQSAGLKLLAYSPKVLP